nr:MmcQ/YjbR family DNA-binding protein [Streptomyces bicolor]
MTPQELRAFCLSLNATVEDFPFNLETSVFKVLGKLFALTNLDTHPLKVNLKCDPEDAIRLRGEHPGLIVPGWHMLCSLGGYPPDPRAALEHGDGRRCTPHPPRRRNRR